MQNENKLLDSQPWASVIALLIIFSVVTTTIESLSDLSPALEKFLNVSEVFIVIIFSAEYLYRLYCAKNRVRFATSFFGLVDLLAIIPFYLSFAFDLRSLRVIRLLRMIRLLKLARYNAALSTMSQALVQAKEELVISILALGIVIYLAAFGIYQFEHIAQPDKFVTMFDALWWAIATITTVGYGDIYPITLGGRVFTFVVLIAGLGLVAVPAGIFASALMSVKAKKPEP